MKRLLALVRMRVRDHATKCELPQPYAMQEITLINLRRGSSRQNPIKKVA